MQVFFVRVHVSLTMRATARNSIVCRATKWSRFATNAIAAACLAAGSNA